MSTKRIVVLLILVAAAAAIVILVTRNRGKNPEAPAAKAAPTAEVSAPVRREDGHPEGATLLFADDDPTGPLRLEGQVWDADGVGVRATVYVDTKPPRHTQSETDGSFAFDGLIARRYALRARTHDRVGGPVVHQLTEKSAPVVVRLSAGAELAVTVLSAASQKPIAGARVGLAQTDDLIATTDAKGVARLKPIPTGANVIVAGAKGYAPARQIAWIEADTSTAIEQQIALSPGAPVSGTVADKDGHPIGNAKVLAVDISSFINLADAKDDGVISDAQGKFEVAALADGTYRFIAVHKEYAPGTSRDIKVDATGRTDVRIVMERGASISGRVENADGTPAAWAQVHVARDPKASGFLEESTAARQVAADKAGQFHIAALTPTRLVIHARSDDASSEIVALDLGDAAEHSDVVLKLSVRGAIAGVVVDERGAGIAEQQVIATPDFWQGGNIEDLIVRGPAFATTDGDGRFAVTGLANGPFRVAVFEPGSGRGRLQQGVAAKTGDSGVKIVMATPGAITGKLLLKDGTAPRVATVTVIFKSASVPRGEFKLGGIDPGTHDVSFQGPEFPEKVIQDVPIEPGKTKNLGTITVDKGRIARGTVVDGSGRPVEGAIVLLGKQVISSGKSLTPTELGAMAQQMGLRQASTDHTGSFFFGGIEKGGAALVAEHAERGRSMAQSIGDGEKDEVLTLRLVPFGGVRGHVKLAGKPASGLTVLLGPTSGAKHLVIVKTVDDGAYEIEKVASGEYKLTVVSGSGASASMVARQVSVPAGGVATADFTITEGNVTLRVIIEGKDGAEITAAQVFLFEGTVSAKNGAEINDLFLNAVAAGSAKMAFALGQAAAEFAKVTSGAHSVCTIPINGDMSNPDFARRLQRQVERLAVYCEPLVIGSGPTQTYKAVVPPMTPLAD